MGPLAHKAKGFRSGSLTRPGATSNIGERWAIEVRTEFGGVFGSNSDTPRWLARFAGEPAPPLVAKTNHTFSEGFSPEQPDKRGRRLLEADDHFFVVFYFTCLYPATHL